MAQTRVTNVRTGDGSVAPVASEPKAEVVGGITFVKDAKGRRIGLKKPSPGDRFELDDAIATKTQSAALQVSVVGCLVSIDDEGFPPLWTYDENPTPREEFKKRLELLGDEGLMVLTGAALRLFGIEIDKKTAARAKN